MGVLERLMALQVDQRVRYHTNGQVMEAVADAIEIADQAQLSPEDRAVLLPTILQLTSSAHIAMSDPSMIAGLAGLGHR